MAIKPPPIGDEDTSGSAPLDAADLSNEPLLSDDFDDHLRAEVAEARSRPIEPAAPAPVDAAADDAVDADRDPTQVAADIEKSLTPVKPAGKKESVVDPAAAPAAATPAAAAPAAAAEGTPVAGTQPAPAAQTPASAQPAPARPSYDPDEEIALTADYRIKRGTMYVALQQREAAIADATSYRAIFRMDPDLAKQVWGPIVDSLIADPEKAKYVEDALNYYDEKKYGGRRGPAPVVAQTYENKEVNERLARLEGERASERAEMSRRAVEMERVEMTRKYPALSDPRVTALVANAALMKIQGNPQRGEAPDPTYTFSRAAEDMSEMLARMAPTPIVDPPVQQPAVPALNGARGAAPGGARKEDVSMNVGPFKSTDDAVDDWKVTAKKLGFS